MTDEEIPFGRYRLQERLAVGGMAELYRAVLPGPSGFSKTVAIKKIVPQLNKHSRFRKMFLHEGRIMAALSHRNVVQVFELGEVEGELYMCLELVVGCDLARVLRRQEEIGEPLPPALAVRIAREVCRGLEFVHNLRDDRDRPLRVVHRDVNPHNILLSRHGDAKLGDFGIAKSLVGEVHTMQGQVRGKLEYLSPEQSRGDTVGPAADIFAVGLVLFEMLTNQRYVQGSTHMEKMQSAARPLWRPIRPVHPAVSEVLEAVVRRALREEPERRFATASAMADALTQILEAEPRMPGSEDVADLVARTCDDLPDPDHQVTLPSGEQPLLDQAPRQPARDEHGFRTVSLAGQPEDPGPRARRKFLSLAVGTLVGLGVVLLVLLNWPEHTVPPTDPDPIPAPSEIEPVDPPPVPDEPADEDPGPDDVNPEEIVIEALVPPRPPRKKRRRRKTKRRKKTTIAVVETPVEPPPKEPATLAQLRQEWRRQRQRIGQKGIRRGDLPKVDALLDRLERRIQGGNRTGADEDLRALDRALDTLLIDRDFIERKMKRLQRTLSHAGLESRFSAKNRAILNHAINNRFGEANAAINRVFAELQRLKKKGR